MKEAVKLPPRLAWIEHLKKSACNPVIRPQGAGPAADAIFNPAAIVHDGRVGLLCRAITFTRQPRDSRNWSVSTLVWAWSDDGFHFELDEKPAFDPGPDSPYQGGFEDPRLVKIGDEYVLTFTGVHNFDRTPGLIAFSRDLKHWEWGGEVLPGRAIAITRERIGGYYYGYWGNSCIFLARSRDLRSWETLKEPALRPRPGRFDALLCESAAPPLLTDDGILLFYNGDRGREQAQNYARGIIPCYVHDILWTCYSTGWALFDRHDPSRLLARCEEPVLTPERLYEIFGISFYTVFAQGYVEFKGRRFLYYGCADMRIGVATAEM